MKGRLRRTVAGLFLFGISFGYVEAAVVIYLRALYEPLRQRLTPGRASGDLFPLVDRDRMVAAAPETGRLLTLEVIREAATIVMLVSVALLAASKTSTRWAAFLWVFALWDIAYYAGLWATVRWPASLTDLDVLFLIPVPWIAQVWFPLLVSGLTVSAIAISSARKSA